MDKQGQGGLSMNTIVVAIIAIIVLLLIVTFFTGGLSTIGQKITEIFKKGTAGYDLDLAVKNCEDYCARAQRLKDTGVKIETSALCTQTFKLDKSEMVYSCLGQSVGGVGTTIIPGVKCPGITATDC